MILTFFTYTFIVISKILDIQIENLLVYQLKNPSLHIMSFWIEVLEYLLQSDERLRRCL